MSYRTTLQADALKLVAKKLQSSLFEWALTLEQEREAELVGAGR